MVRGGMPSHLRGCSLMAAIGLGNYAWCMTLIPYRDRRSAGQLLADQLRHHFRKEALCLLALPRGGVPVAYEVACALRAPLDVFLVRRLAMPTEPELAIGAITTGNVCVLNSDVLQENGIEISDIEDAVEVERRELERLQQLFRGPRPAEDVRQRPVILVDDGLATGVNMRAAIAVLRAQGPTSITVAVPVGSRTACEQISTEVDEFICPRIPEPFYAVGLSYDQFPRMCDEDIHSFLEKEEHERSLHDGTFAGNFYAGSTFR